MPPGHAAAPGPRAAEYPDPFFGVFSAPVHHPACFAPSDFTVPESLLAGVAGVAGAGFASPALFSPDEAGGADSPFSFAPLLRL
jgi:hypothetical protein